MGIVFVLLFWAVVGVVLATFGAAIFGCLAAVLTRSITRGRRRVVVVASLFPFMCLGWGGAVLVFQAVVNESFLDRDLGIGDTWHTPLPNGYHILMIDVTDQGWVYNPKTQQSSAVVEREDAVAGVRQLQVADRYILGAADTKFFDHLGTNTDQAGSYFILDTQLGKRTQFKDFYALQQRARAVGVEPKLQPIDAVYSSFRFSWFDVLVGLLFVVAPAFGIVLLVLWVVRLRRNRQVAPL
jgi:hypothetical protein